jgi:SnoaL-like domain
MTNSPLGKAARLERQVAELIDHEITNLVYRLGAFLDDRRFDEMRSLLVEEATVRTPGSAAEGREALTDTGRRAFIGHVAALRQIVASAEMTATP